MSFRIIFELESPREPDLKRVLLQIEIFGAIVDAILVTDNHMGIPALSPLAAAIEVRNQGLKAVVALNARDRNHLRLRSDLLTLRAYGIDEVLFLKGDPVDGAPAGVTVREMLREEAGGGMRRGVLATVGKPLDWRRSADFLVAKLGFGRAGADYWRKAEGFSHPLYCGVIALPDAGTARKVLEKIPDLKPPPGYLEAFDDDGEAGFNMAIAEMDELYRSGVEGAHLVVPWRWRRFAQMLEDWIASRGERP